MIGEKGSDGDGPFGVKGSRSGGEGDSNIAPCTRMTSSIGGMSGSSDGRASAAMESARALGLRPKSSRIFFSSAALRWWRLGALPGWDGGGPLRFLGALGCLR